MRSHFYANSTFSSSDGKSKKYTSSHLFPLPINSNSNLLSRLYIIIISIHFLLHFLFRKYFVDLMQFIVEFLVLVLLSCLPTILHLHTKLECSFWHGFLLLVVLRPLLLCLKVPSVKAALRLQI